MRRASIRVCVVTAILITFAASACGPGDATPDGSVDAGIPSSVRIRASEGGVVQSPDGVFTLIVPPNAIVEDTDFSISIVPRSDWPAAASQAPPIGEIYEVEPSGLVFEAPALGVFEWASAPVPGLREGNRATGLQVWTVGEGAAVEPSPEMLTRHYLDGRIAAAGTITHLSPKWASERYTREEGGTEYLFTVAVDADAGEHAVGVPWAARSLAYSSTFPTEMSAVAYVGIAGQQGPHVQVSFPMGAPRIVRHLDPVLVPDAPGAQQSEAVHEDSNGLDVALPAPTWSCGDAGPDAIWAGMRAEGPYVGGSIELEIIVDIGEVSCTGDAVAQPVADHVLVGNTCRLEPTPSGLACDGASSGSTVLIQQLSDAERAGCTALGPSTLRCSAPSGESERGADPIEISTPSASCTATYDDATRRYVCDIAPDQSVFGAGSGETLTIRGTPPGESTPTTITIPATDAITPPESVLGPLAGVDTSIQLADGTFDAVFIRAEVPSASGPPDVVYDLVPASSMTLSDGVRSTPVLTPQLRADGITELIGDVLIGVVHTDEDTTLFSRPLLVAAGRFVEVNAADLEPPPEPGAVVTRSCGSLPYFFTPITGRSFENGLVCLYGDGRCMVTNDLQQDLPLLPSQCGNPDRALVFLGGGVSPSVDTGGAWHMPYASTGVRGALDTTTLPPDGTDEVAIIERVSDGARYRIDYNLGATGPERRCGRALHRPAPAVRREVRRGRHAAHVLVPHDRGRGHGLRALLLGEHGALRAGQHRRDARDRELQRRDVRRGAALDADVGLLDRSQPPRRERLDGRERERGDLLAERCHDAPHRGGRHRGHRGPARALRDRLPLHPRRIHGELGPRALTEAVLFRLPRRSDADFALGLRAKPAPCGTIRMGGLVAREPVESLDSGSTWGETS